MVRFGRKNPMRSGGKANFSPGPGSQYQPEEMEKPETSGTDRGAELNGEAGDGNTPWSPWIQRDPPAAAA